MQRRFETGILNNIQALMFVEIEDKIFYYMT